MGTGLLTPPTRRELNALAAATGFVADRIEKTVRLLALAHDIAAHPYLGGRLALTGGTALNMFVLAAPRLSFDLDYHYIGSANLATMKAERPNIEDALARLLPAHGLGIKRRPNLDRDHAGGKWDLRYRNAFGRSEGLSVDVGYVRRVPLWPTTRHDSHRLGRWQATDVPVFDIHEIAAGKLCALYNRGYARDLFDAGLIPNLPGLDPAKLRTAFVVYGGGARPDWRTVCANPRKVQAPSLGRQLRSALTHTDAQRTRPLSADAYLAELEAKAATAHRIVLPHTPSEQAFLDMLLDWGRVEPQLVTADEHLQGRIATEPWLQWKSHNTRRRLATRPVEVHVRRYQPDNWGWEVATTSPHSRMLSGRHPTLEQAEAARDFLVRLVNVHPQLHIAGPDPQPKDQTPTARIYSHAPDGHWYLLCQDTDGSLDSVSPPYPTHQAASHTLEQLGLLSAATTDHAIGNRALIAPTSNTCRCSLKGWLCKHIDLNTPEAPPPDRGHGLSL